MNDASKKARRDARAAITAALFAMMADVQQFQTEILNLPVEVGRLSPSRFDFKLGHMLEELNEFSDAWKTGNFAEQIDALIDLQYVVMGALLEMGVTPDEAFGTVHDANMRKERGVTKRGESYDAIKPDGWKAPDHEPLAIKMHLLSQVRPALLEATAIMLQRGAKYNGGTVTRDMHFPLGTASIFDILWLKMIRMRADVENGVPVDRDHLRDMINYAGFGIDIIDGRPLE